MVSICLKEADFGLADLALITDAGFGEGAAGERLWKATPFGCDDATPPLEEAAPEAAGGGGAKDRERPLDPRRSRASS